ncbi:MAG: sensor histidine kinase, partial [Chitinophagales bacterium]
VVYEQLIHLNIQVEHTGFIMDYKERDDMHIWLADKHAVPFQVTIPYFDCAHWNSFNEAKEKGLDFFANHLSFEEKNKFYQDLFQLIPGVPEESLEYYFSCPGLAISTVLLENVGLYIENFSGIPYTDEENATLMRFGKVFQQTYTRFLDLQNAETQAREAKVEASLERVRSKTIAMHNSDDVGETVATMFGEFINLGIYTNRCGILIFNDEHVAEVWTARSTPGGNAKLITGKLDLDAHKMLRSIYDAWKAKQKFYQYDLLDKDLKLYYTAINNSRFYPTQFDLNALPSKEFHSDFFFADGALFSFTNEPLLDEYATIFKRFAGVFGQTYRRYLDLQRAEAQAREAKIEAALEKVRGKAIAMHNSNDLSVTASMIFTELRKLGIHSIRCGVGLLNKESMKAQLYSATSSADGADSLSLIGWIELSNHPVSEKIYTSWVQNEDYYPELSGEQLKSYYENLLAGLSLPSVPNWQSSPKQYGTFLPFSIGCLYAWSDIPYNETQIKILKRFATVIDLTFRRYMELQTSEANARDAVKQAALDRIRADIASMRTIGDLDRITPLIWNELTILGVPFIRCGVFIMDESQRLIHTFLSTPDGKAIAAFHLPYNTPGNISQVLNHWHHSKNYIDHWDEEAFTEFAGTLVKQGALDSPEQYLKTIPHGGFHLHFLPFLQGMLYVGNTNRLGDDEIQLIQSVADAFSTAYARYEDFNKLEAAKQQVEKTLTDLKQAQTLLIQSEKMASLGELTAGIAHEIQNPLNFVNNFSEVSNELIEEMVDEVKKGNKEEAQAIANDIRQNLEKILNHGKRADAIVKGMLQHSRTSSGQKELIDINVLADEYLRLAFHGLRAKDKTFNAKFETDFDPSIEKINVIPQDIGRVILNLINNAFYAAPLPPEGGFKDPDYKHEPTVWVGTRKVGDKVLISVRDNGPGIPQKVLDKIFQPFFTTKPTGQGTGLGLSLSYDIIKAHGGEIKVETKEREGSKFIIQLPLKDSN